MQRRHTLQALGATLLAPLGTLTARAQGPAPVWPARPLKLIVPFPPGGTTDLVARLVAAQMASGLGQPVVVDNKPGAGTVIGVDAGAKAAPDGLTLTCVANSFCVNQTLVKNLPYDGLRDLRPVGLMGQSEHVLASHPGSGLRTLADLRAAAQKPSARLSYASFGSGTSAHLAGEMLREQMGIELTHIPYKGQAPALNDLLGGQVTLMFGNWPEFRGHVQSGKLVAVGMATAKRSALAPDIPTLAEQGVAIESNSWNGLLVPAATPDALVQRLNTELRRALDTAAVREAFAKGGISSLAGTPEQFGAFIQSEISRYAQVIRSARISADS
ncbi:tripartite tricarboxylate transporter substrate binding protein [Curvibacter sp. HBC28]|uniref:Tripartite tricarboxylate transporter substrate binding protein n=1 Tax=Curvibacter microcysteis TaxID=3026419 RepID=A0ABT5MB73_9BURK|nr:tripartite tricarboxylate transporter substrate binding protein [Curvibacter sp. HBC28]MDD0813822.1 tripartite tricarboxylate transporter substrate binding protein [Curvibacter sp. HBC28]